MLIIFSRMIFMDVSKNTTKKAPSLKVFSSYLYCWSDICSICDKHQCLLMHS